MSSRGSGESGAAEDIGPEPMADWSSSWASDMGGVSEACEVLGTPTVGSVRPSSTACSSARAAAEGAGPACCPVRVGSGTCSGTITPSTVMGLPSLSMKVKRLRAGESGGFDDGSSRSDTVRFAGGRTDSCNGAAAAGAARDKDTVEEAACTDAAGEHEARSDASVLSATCTDVAVEFEALTDASGRTVACTDATSGVGTC